MIERAPEPAIYREFKRFPKRSFRVLHPADALVRPAQQRQVVDVMPVHVRRDALVLVVCLFHRRRFLELDDGLIPFPDAGQDVSIHMLRVRRAVSEFRIDGGVFDGFFVATKVLVGVREIVVGSGMVRVEFQGFRVVRDRRFVSRLPLSVRVVLFGISPREPTFHVVRVVGEKGVQNGPVGVHPCGFDFIRLRVDRLPLKQARRDVPLFAVVSV